MPQATPSEPFLGHTTEGVNARVNAVIERLRVETEGFLGAGSKADMVRLEALLRGADLHLQKRLADWSARHGGDTASFTPASAAAYRAQVGLVLQQVQAQLKKHTGKLVGTAWAAGSMHAAKSLHDLEVAFTGISRAPRIAEALRLDPTSPRGGSVLRSYATSVDRYGQAMIGQFEQHIALGFAAGLSQYEMTQLLTGHGGPTGEVSLAAKVVNGQVVRTKTAQIPEGLFARHRYWAQRIVRTETANAYNAARLARFDRFAAAGIPLKKKILAHFDARTAMDSVLVHGQIRDLSGPGSYFQDGAGRTYEHPPARPNDRETTIPWLDEWSETTSTAPLTQAEAQVAGARLKAGQAPFDPAARRLADLAQEQASAQARGQAVLAGPLAEWTLPPGWTIKKSSNYNDVFDASGTKRGYFKDLPGTPEHPERYDVSPPLALQKKFPPTVFTNRMEAARYAITVSEAIEAEKVAQAAAKAAEEAAKAQAAAAAKAASEAAAKAAAAKAAEEAAAAAQAQAAAQATAQAEARAKALKAPAPFAVEGVARRLVDAEHRAWLKVVDAERAKDGGLRTSGAARSAWLKAHEAAYRLESGDMHAGAPRRLVDYVLPPQGRSRVSKAIQVPWGEAPPSPAWKLAGRHDPADPHVFGQAGVPLRTFGSSRIEHYTDPSASIPGILPVGGVVAPVSGGAPGRGVFYSGSRYASEVGLRHVDFEEDPISILSRPEARTQTGVAIPADHDQFENMEVRARVMFDEDGQEFFHFSTFLRDDVGDALLDRQFQIGEADASRGFVMDHRRADYRWWPSDVAKNPRGQLRLSRPTGASSATSAREGGSTMRYVLRTPPDPSRPRTVVYQSRDRALSDGTVTREVASRRDEIAALHNRLEVRVYASDARAALAEFERRTTEIGLVGTMARPNREAVQTQVRAQILSRYSSETSRAIRGVADRLPATVDRTWKSMLRLHPELARIEETTSYVHTAGGSLGMYSDALSERIRSTSGATHLEHMIGAFSSVPTAAMVDIFRSMSQDPGGAALLSTLERWDRGMLYAGGASSDKDTRTGGAGGVFTRFRDEQTVGSVTEGRARFRIRTGEFGRIDAWSHQGDEYGEAGKPSRRLFAHETSANVVRRMTSNELISRGSIPLRSVESIALHRSQRDDVIRGLEGLGIASINGIPLAKFFVDPSQQGPR